VQFAKYDLYQGFASAMPQHNRKIRRLQPLLLDRNRQAAKAGKRSALTAWLKVRPDTNRFFNSTTFRQSPVAL
jgi:hypothetical protein